MLELEPIGPVQEKTSNWMNHIKEGDHTFPVLGLMNNNNSYLYLPYNLGASSHGLSSNRMRLLLSHNQAPDYYIQILLGKAPIREAVFYHQSDGYNCGPYSIMHALSVTGQPTKFGLTTENIRQRANQLRTKNEQAQLSSTAWFSFDDIREVLRDTVQGKCRTVMTADQKSRFDPRGTSCFSYEELIPLLNEGQITCVIINVDENHFYTCVPTPNSRFIILDSLQAEPEIIISSPKSLVKEWSLKEGLYYNKEFLVVTK